MNKIVYKSGYKYQLKANYAHIVNILPDIAIDSPFLSLTKNGLLSIKTGYAWDGPSGPAFHTKSFMRGSLVHDALYQLMREGDLPISDRAAADQMLKTICLEDGMFKFRAWYVHLAVKTFGKPYTDPKNDHPLEVAP